MSRFFVGQRVRLVRPAHPSNLGREYIITAMIPERMTSSGVANCIIAPPMITGLSHTSRLEPILPEGHRACDDEFKRDLDKLLEGMPA